MRALQAETSLETDPRGRPSLIWGLALTPQLPPSMATCDIDDGFGLLGDDDDGGFGLLGDDDAAQHPPPETKPDPSHPPPQLQAFYLPQKLPVSSGLAAGDELLDRKNHHAAATKRRGGAEKYPGDFGEYCSYFNSGGGGGGLQGRKKERGRSGAPSPGADDDRDGREGWSEEAICSFLDAYTERFEQLGRRNFRRQDWDDVAAAVAARHPARDGGDGGKSVVQCKNKLDNLKKRYKVECQKVAGCGSACSSWPWFKKMDFIMSKATSITSPGPATSTDDVKPRLQQQQNNEGCTPSRLTASTGSIGVGSRLTPPLKPKRWKRALLKIGGSLLSRASSENVDPKVVMLIATEVQVAILHGVQVAIVMGSRNIYRGDTWAAATGINRASTYPIGMMASVMNAVLLQASLEKIGIETRVQTSLMMQDATESYIRQRAIRHLEKGRVVIFGGIGTSMGNPLFTTDTAAALRASEINADVLLKGITGDSLYDCPPGSNGNATLEHISYRELVARGVSKIDVTAVTLCEENNIPVVLFNMLEPGNISRTLCGDQVGTLVDQTGRIS